MGEEAQSPRQRIELEKNEERAKAAKNGRTVQAFACVCVVCVWVCMSVVYVCVFVSVSSVV